MCCLVSGLIVFAFGFFRFTRAALWDHEAHHGVAVLEASFLFYLPLIDIVATSVSSEKNRAPRFTGHVYFVGQFRADELSDKVMITAEIFPLTLTAEYL